MQKNLSILATLAFAQSTDAFRTSSLHPFSGANRDANVVEFEERTTHRAHAVKASSKYDSLINKETITKRKTAHEQFFEYFLGASDEQVAFEQALENNKSKTPYGKNRLGVEQTVTVSQPKDGVYAASIVMGQREQMDTILDTATDMVAMQGVECLDCTGETYAISNNLDSGVATISSSLTKASYGAQEFYGNWATDKVCLSMSSCVDDQDFFYIKTASNFDESIDGVLGLARPNNDIILNPSSTPRNERKFFLENLELQAKEFSTRFSSSMISWVDFGAANEFDYQTSAPTMQLYDDFFWSLDMDAIRIGELETGFKFMPDSQAVTLGARNSSVYTIMDTGSSDILLSDIWFSSFIEELYDSMKVYYEVQNGVPLSSCDAYFPNLYFMVNEHWIKVNSDDYVFDATAAQDGSVCGLKIRPINAPFNILGMPAFLDYYVTHSFADGAASLRISPHGDSRKEVPSKASVPTAQLSVSYATQNVLYGDWISLTLALFICFFGAVYATWYFNNYYHNSVASVWSTVGLIILSYVVCFLGFFVLEWVFLFFLWPGNNVVIVDPADSAIVSVKASHVTFFSLVSFAAYKCFGKKQETKQTPETEVEASVEPSTVNALE